MDRHWLAVASVVSAAVVVVVAFVWAAVALGPSRLVVAVAELVVVAAVDQVPESVETASALEASAVL